MKVAAILLAILLFALNFIPCGDAAIEHDQHAAIASHTPHSDSDTHEDNCSPLCTCSCCSIASMPETMMAVETVAETCRPPQAATYSGNLLDIALPIWQPPQLRA